MALTEEWSDCKSTLFATFSPSRLQQSPPGWEAPFFFSSSPSYFSIRCTFFPLIIFQEVRAEEQQLVLASEALSSYMKAYIDHYRRQKEGFEVEEDEDKSPLVEDDDEDFLEYDNYEIGTSEESRPNVNWTMLKPR